MKPILLPYLLGIALVCLRTSILAAEPQVPPVKLQPQNESDKAMPAPNLPVTSNLPNVSAERQSVLEDQEKQAAKGDSQALYVMGLRYLAGVDVPKDEKKAREFLRAAEEKGDLRARNKILELDRAARNAEMEARAAIATLALHPPSGTNSVSVLFSPDGSQIVTTLSEGGAIRIWDLQRGRSTMSIDSHTTVEFSPDGKQIITTSPDKVRRLWDLGTGRLMESDRKP